MYAWLNCSLLQSTSDTKKFKSHFEFLQLFNCCLINIKVAFECKISVFMTGHKNSTPIDSLILPKKKKLLKASKRKGASTNDAFKKFTR
jgi:hypothetical protein